MPFQATITRLQTELDQTFYRLDDFFELPMEVRTIHPAPEEWCIDQILEHITLTNRFLMITLSQSLEKALRRAQTQPLPTDPSDLEKILVIGNPDAFAWIRPEHMQPVGIPIAETKALLQSQHQECSRILAQLPNGEGALHKVRMSVQELGHLDMYQWLYFIIQHAQRHIIEMERILQNR